MENFKYIRLGGILNLFKNLSVLNIKRRPGRSVGIGALVFCLALSLFMAGFIGASMKNGLESTKERLGADIIVLPVDAESDFEGALLTGKPSSIYLNNSVMDDLEKIEGIEKMSPQVYIASLSASCCSFPVQIIGIDMETDFSVRPWLDTRISDLEEGEILVGANIVASPGSDLLLFGNEYKVKEKLSKTGMGFDNSVFMTIESARKAGEDAVEKGVSSPIGEENLISNVMVRVDKDTRPDFVSYDINKSLEGKAKALRSDSLMTSIAKQMSSSANYILILLAIVWVLAIAVLLIVFPMITRSRMGELVTLRILGARKKDISRILAKEMLILSFIGALIGAGLGAVLSNLFATAIKSAIDMPFLRPLAINQLGLGIVTLVICTIIGPLSAMWTISKLNKEEIALTYSREA